MMLVVRVSVTLTSMTRMKVTILKITDPSLLVSPAEERAKPNLDSVKPSVRRIGAVEESSLEKVTTVMMVVHHLEWN